MRYHKALLATATLAVALLEGCINDHNPTTNAPAPPMSSSPSPQATPAAYAMPGDVCTAVSADAFADLVPAASAKAAEKGRTQAFG